MNAVENAVADLTGFRGEADPECENPMQRVRHARLAAKQSPKDVAGKHKAGQREAADRGGGGAGPWKSGRSGTAKKKPSRTRARPHTRRKEQLSGAHVKEVNVDAKDGSDDDATVRGTGASPPYVDFRRNSFHWRARRRRAVLTRYAAFCLQKLRMAFIETRASTSSRQADTRECCGEGGGVQLQSAVRYCT